MSKRLANIHDAFFRQALSDPELAATFLREHLPTELAELLGPEPPEPLPGSFVDEELRQHHSDLLFRIQLKTGGNAFAYVLMEHKSSPDHGARLQLLRYIVRVLTDYYEQNEHQLPLPPVLPLLANQGPDGWRFSCEFRDLFGSVPEVLRPYLPSFQHVLVDLSRIDDPELLSSQVRLRAFLKTLKFGRRSDLREYIDFVLAEAPDLKEADLFVILTYLDKVRVRVDIEVLRSTLQKLIPDRTERIMGWITQPYYDKGLAEGKAIGEARGEAKGEAKGEASGKAKVLARFLEKRFGAIPAAMRQRLFDADARMIDVWVERALEAKNLRAVFETN
jgi:predicted transposase/invertase (TIGR01784 family)